MQARIIDLVVCQIKQLDFLDLWNSLANKFYHRVKDFTEGNAPLSSNFSIAYTLTSKIQFRPLLTTTHAS